MQWFGNVSTNFATEHHLWIYLDLKTNTQKPDQILLIFT